MTTRRSGRRSTRWRARSAARRRRCGRVRQAERDGGRGRGRRARSASGSRRSTARCGAAPGQRDPPQGFGVFCPGGARPPIQDIIAFHRRSPGGYGVEPICKCCRSPRPPPTPRSRAAAIRKVSSAAAARRLAPRRDPARATRRTSGLRIPEGLAAARPRGRLGALCTWNPYSGLGLRGVTRGREARPPSSPCQRLPAPPRSW